MKKFKKLAALLLMVALVLSALTACSESVTRPLGEQLEEAYIESFNNWRDPELPKLTNDATLRALAEQAFDALDPDTGLIDQEKLEKMQVSGVARIEIMSTDRGRSAVCFTQKMVDGIKNQRAPDPNNAQDREDMARFNRFEAIGIATREINGKTYMADAIRVYPDGNAV